MVFAGDYVCPRIRVYACSLCDRVTNVPEKRTAENFTVNTGERGGEGKHEWRAVDAVQNRKKKDEWSGVRVGRRTGVTREWSGTTRRPTRA